MASELGAAEAAYRRARARVEAEGPTWNAIAAYVFALANLRQVLDDAA
jgi:hypothetical protein